MTGLAHTYYGTGHILQGVSLRVGEGEAVALLGRNGAGKTTTLKSIVGLAPHSVRHFGNYNATYGSIGGVILLVLWLYVSSLVLLLGAEINSEIEEAAAKRGHPEAKAPGEMQAPADELRRAS